MVWYIVGIWYGISLVYDIVVYGMVVYGMVHRWFIWYGTSLVYGMVVYGMVHRWYMVWYIVDI